MTEPEHVPNPDMGELRHEILNHLHVLLGNLELLAEARSQDEMIRDAYVAAQELRRLLRVALR